MRIAVAALALAGCGSSKTSPPDVPINAPWQTASTTFDQSLIGVWASGTASELYAVGGTTPSLGIALRRP